MQLQVRGGARRTQERLPEGLEPLAELREEMAEQKTSSKAPDVSVPAPMEPSGRRLVPPPAGHAPEAVITQRAVRWGGDPTRPVQ